jgi:predicted metal-dependent peptidase
MFITQTNQLSGLKRVERAHVELMAHKETMEYASVIFVGKYEVSDKVPTACTNGVDCMYGRAFIEDLSDSDLRGLIMHENLHKLFQHTFLWKHLYEQNARCANMACDYVINVIIKDIEAASGGFVTLPKGGLYDERFRGMDSQEVFNILMEERDDDGDEPK